ncbi:glycosyltransferase family 2 protein [Pseudomonas alabamensis]|uniref:glycosyltransferase family 2 protein n=1 Tax=Pseudomonas alabamensis TaxID=3064349 RepID=UPI0021D90AEC|nr:glycosyltransferase family 2 protein [Pseudomonas entomophila]
MKNYRIAILMMLKDESDLALPWVEYHGTVFGYENLFIYDNGSTDQSTISAVKFAHQKGANCYFDKSTFEDFKAKGDIFSAKIKELDAEGGFDFYFPLDCDEFLSAKLDDKFVFDLENISKALKPYEKSPDQLKIGFCPTNHPNKASFFKNSASQRKFFFAQGSCQKLDHGFHHGITKTGITVTTEIAYFHFHYRNFESIQFHAKKKLSGFIENFETETVKAYRGSGFHLTQYLLQDKARYYSQFDSWECEYVPELIAEFDKLKIKPPFAN